MPGGNGDGGIPRFGTGLTSVTPTPTQTRNEKLRARAAAQFEEGSALIESNTSLTAKDKRRQTKRLRGRTRLREAGEGKGGTSGRLVSSFGSAESFIDELRESDKASRTGLGNTVEDRTAAGGGVGAGAVGTFGRGVIGTNIIKKRRDA